MRFFHIFVMGLLSLLLTSCFVFNSINLMPTPQPPVLKTLSGEGKDMVLVIDINGLISEMPPTNLLGQGSGQSMVASVYEQVELAKKSPNIKALLLRIDSPGGTVSASDELYHILMEYRSETGKPIYAMMGSVAASGGYYVAMSANEVYARPTTLTGSLGVIMHGIGFEGLMDKIGVTNRVTKSGEFKDIGSPARAPTDEEHAIMQSIVGDYYGQFLTVIEGNRKTISAADIKRHADGRIYTARQAKHLGLIDGITHLPELIDEIGKDLSIEPHVVILAGKKKRLSGLYAEAALPYQAPESLLEAALPDGLRQTPLSYPAGPYYLWLP